MKSCVTAKQSVPIPTAIRDRYVPGGYSHVHEIIGRKTAQWSWCTHNAYVVRMVLNTSPAVRAM